MDKAQTGAGGRPRKKSERYTARKAVKPVVEKMGTERINLL